MTLRHYYDATTEAEADQLADDVASALEGVAPVVQGSEDARPEEDGGSPHVGCDDDAVASPLSLPDFTAAADEIARQAFYDPALVIEALSSLATGHLIVAGPPGTGKSLLVKLLASAFRVELRVATGNPEWSVYDLIGSISLDPEGRVTPKHGLVTQAVLDCCRTVSRSLEEEGYDGPQAIWLLIDEMNRADIDRAFGPLFTALADPAGGTMALDHVSGSPELPIPWRFRIIGTLNSYDARFVNSMSAALRRRFARIALLPPDNDADGKLPAREFEVAVAQARAAVERVFDPTEVARAAGHLDRFAEDLRHFLGAIRSSPSAGGIPFGTAQVLDSCAHAMSLLITIPDPGNEAGRKDIIDRAFAGRLTTALESDSTRARVGDDFITYLSDHFAFPRTVERLQAFLQGRD